MKQTLKTLLPLGALLALGVSSARADVFSVSTDITVNTTWSTGNEYVLEQPIFVKNGALLTIQKGVIVRGQPRSDADTYNPGNLTITRDGSINAQGTAIQPIIFTTAAVDNDDDGAWDANPSVPTLPKRWTVGDTFHDALPATEPLAPYSGPVGGVKENRGLYGSLVILGRAPNNVASNAGSGLTIGERYIEGLNASVDGVYGGSDANDSSGVLKYISLRYGGANLSTANEINGLTLGSVGQGTKVEYIEAYCNADDGFEFFGGNVNCKYLASIYNNDDCFDFDEGYTGQLQFLFGILMPTIAVDLPVSNLTVKNSDNLFESDGDHRADSGNEANLFNRVFNQEGTEYLNFSYPKTFPLIYNVTGIGGGPNGLSSDSGDQRAFRLRHNFGGYIFNSIIAEFKGKAVRCDGSASLGTTDSTRWRVDNGELAIDNCIFWNFQYTGDPVAPTNTAAGLANSSYEEKFFNGTVSTLANSIINPGFEPQSYFTTNGVNPVPLRPGFGGGGAVITNLEPYTSAFFTSVGYKGAFSNTQTSTLWTTGWTALNVSGVLVDYGNE